MSVAVGLRTQMSFYVVLSALARQTAYRSSRFPFRLGHPVKVTTSWLAVPMESTSWESEPSVG